MRKVLREEGQVLQKVRKEQRGVLHGGRHNHVHGQESQEVQQASEQVHQVLEEVQEEGLLLGADNRGRDGAGEE